MVDTKVKSLNASVSAVAVVAKAAKAGNVDKPIHTWIGGARNGRHAGSWQDFVYDRIEFDTSAPYFQRLSSTRFKALKDGLFRINAHWITHDNSNCWRHRQFKVDNKVVDYGGHSYSHSWEKNDIDITWYIKAGQQFWIQSYTGSCGNSYVWHGSSNWVDAHNRVAIEYVGQLEGKCSSQFKLC